MLTFLAFSVVLKYWFWYDEIGRYVLGMPEFVDIFGVSSQGLVGAPVACNSQSTSCE